MNSSIESRVWGIIGDDGILYRCSYPEFINYCRNIIHDKYYMSYLIAIAMNFSFNNIPARIGVNNKYIAMWNANDREGTYKKFNFI